MDDLADGVSFCIVPAWMFYIAFGAIEDPFIQKLAAGPIAVFYALMGIIRLIYFTLDKIPYSGVLQGAAHTGRRPIRYSAPHHAQPGGSRRSGPGSSFWGIFCASLMIFSGIIMNIYPIHYLHLGRFMSRKPWFARSSMLLLVAFVFTPFLGHMAFFYLFLYLLSPLVTWRIDPEVAAKETHKKEPTEQ